MTAALTSRLIDGSSGRERLRASVGQIQYFEDRRVNLYPELPAQTAANSGLIAQERWNLSSHWSVQGAYNWSRTTATLLRTAFDLALLRDFPSVCQPVLPAGSRPVRPGVERSNPLRGCVVGVAANLRLRVLARWNQALNIDRNLETLAGLEYEDCCWAFRAVARQYRDSPLEDDAQTGFYLELELKGLTRLGGGLGDRVAKFHLRLSANPLLAFIPMTRMNKLACFLLYLPLVILPATGQTQLVFGPGPEGTGSALDAIAAVVNDDVITRRELEAATATIKIQLRQQKVRSRPIRCWRTKCWNG